MRIFCLWHIYLLNNSNPNVAAHVLRMGARARRFRCRRPVGFHHDGKDWLHAKQPHPHPRIQCGKTLRFRHFMPAHQRQRISRHAPAYHPSPRALNGAANDRMRAVAVLRAPRPLVRTSGNILSRNINSIRMKFALRWNFLGPRLASLSEACPGRRHHRLRQFSPAELRRHTRFTNHCSP